MKLKSHWANTQYTVSKMYLVQHSVDLNFGQTGVIQGHQAIIH